MSKIVQSLLPGERVEYQGTIHNIVYLVGVLLLPLWGFGVIVLFAAWATQKMTEVVVTDRRVIVRHGVAIMRTDEIPLAQVQAIQIQGDATRAFANVTIVGSGGTEIRVNALANPSGLRNAVARFQA
jgi:uncharacterized membrane protein YdbT with pleckstrin-like domain